MQDVAGDLPLVGNGVLGRPCVPFYRYRKIGVNVPIRISRRRERQNAVNSTKCCRYSIELIDQFIPLNFIQI